MNALWRRGPKVEEICPSKLKLYGPSIVLMDPKYPHNVGQVVRLASCWGINNVVYTGSRVDLMGEDSRVPREERMRDYASVNLVNYDRPFDILTNTPIGVEIRENSEDLRGFIHPDNATYVFGPEDGGLGRVTLSQCHRFIKIPSKHCLNLGTAVATVLYDRVLKNGLQVV